ncbi:TRAF-like family protein [Abeliophyllum distichum]|uniref:TRAF-like family protein n=1 Tax=Abeliophyllum distichum TaxID=126358 RepID=A0ABD1W028_9LAMI
MQLAGLGIMKRSRKDKIIPNSNEELETLRVMRNQRPAHYTLKIESFSQLQEMVTRCPVPKYESANFSVGGYEWRLSLYPNGDSKRNGNGYISLYLVLAEESNLPFGAEVIVLFRLFVYNHSHDKYLVVQDASETMGRFNAVKHERGFSQLLDLSTFKDAASGYLRKDSCIFGAEVFVIECTDKGERLSFVRSPVYNSNFTWSIKNFSREKRDYIKSDVFSSGGHKWCLTLYPKGHISVKGTSFSFFLNLEDHLNLMPRQKFLVKFELRVKNQLTSCYRRGAGSGWFSSTSPSYGWVNFMPLCYLNDSSKGFVVKDNLVAEGQILLTSTSKHC